MMLELSILVAAIVLFLVLERLPSVRRSALRVARPGSGADVVLGLVSHVALGLAGARAVQLALEALGGAGWPQPLAALPAYASLPIAVVLVDLGNYVAHVLLHRFDALWHLHAVHHSSRELDWLASYRAHPLEMVFRRFAAPALLVLGGFPPHLAALVGAAYQVWIMFNHSNIGLDLRWMERLLLVTPRLHRAHHAAATSLRNYGTVFTVWDRIFRTAATSPNPAEPLGVPDEIETYPQHLGGLLAEPLRRISRDHGDDGGPARAGERGSAARAGDDASVAR